MNKYTTRKLICFVATMLLCTQAVADNKKARLSRLKNLNWDELLEVKIKLDDVFNVFDGLIKAKKVTVATGTAQSTAKAPAVTTVITAQDIEATGAKDLDEVLESVPGLHVSRSNVGYTPIYTVRGVYSNFNPELLLLINGIPLNNIHIGNRGQAWGGMPVGMISRVEVIRGPGSAVFGADAFSGVINVITKTYEEIDGTEGGVRYGSFDSRNVWLLHGGKLDNDFDIAVGLEYFSSDGQREVVDSDLETIYDQQFGGSASLAPGPVQVQRDNLDIRLELSKDLWKLRGGYQKRRNYGLGAGSDEALDNRGYYVDNRFNADLTYHNPEFSDNWDVTAEASYLRSGWDTPEGQLLHPPGTFGGLFPNGMIAAPAAYERHVRLNLSGFYSGIEAHTIRVGGGYHFANLYRTRWRANFVIGPIGPVPLGEVTDFSDTDGVYLGEGRRRNWHTFVQDIWRISSAWELTAGLRYDEYSDFGSTLNPRMALVWQTLPDLTSKLLYGRAFRAPSFLEQHGANNPVARGNPNLEPETVQTVELAFDYRVSENLHTALNLFHYRIKDGIEFLPDPEGTATAQNSHGQRGSGFEFEVRWKTSDESSLLFNYAYQNAQIDENNDHPHQNSYDGEAIAKVPQHTAYLRLDRLLTPAWYLNAQANWVASRKRDPNDMREPIDDYVTVDLSLRRKDIRGSNWNFAVGVRNLFDGDVREPSSGPNLQGLIGIPNDLPMAGRSYFAEVRYKF